MTPAGFERRRFFYWLLTTVSCLLPFNDSSSAQKADCGAARSRGVVRAGVVCALAAHAGVGRGRERATADGACGKRVGGHARPDRFLDEPRARGRARAQRAGLLPLPQAQGLRGAAADAAT